MLVIPMFANSINSNKSNVALIDGKEVPYEGLTSPEVSYEQARKYYPESGYNYLGAGVLVAVDIAPAIRHFFTHKKAAAA